MSGGADEFEGEGVRGFLEFFRGDRGRRVIGDGGGEDGDVHAPDVAGDGVMHLGGGFHRQEIDAVRHIEGGGAGNQQHRVAGAGEGGGEFVAHLSRTSGW